MDKTTFDRAIQIVVATATIFVTATALLWMSIQHVMFLNHQLESIKLQTATMQNMAQMGAERLEVLRSVMQHQSEMQEALKRIEDRQTKP